MTNTDERLRIRKLWIADRQPFVDHLLRLDGSTRRLRFGMAASDAFLNNYAANAFALNSVLYGCFAGDVMRGAGELRYLFGTEPLSAEAAFAVEPSWQGKGIGRALLGRVITTARHRFVKVVHMICLAENQRMRHLIDGFRNELSVTPGETSATILRANAPSHSDVRPEGRYVRAMFTLPGR